MNEKPKPLTSIREFCYECCGFSRADVKTCPSKKCPLWPFRFGKNPYVSRNMSEEQRRKSAERLKKYRKENAK